MCRRTVAQWCAEGEWVSVTGPNRILLWLNVAVAIVTILGAVKSAYNGKVRRIWNAIMLIPDMDERVKETQDRVDDIGEGLVAYVEYDQRQKDNGFKVENLRSNVGVGPPRRAYYEDHGADDEEE